jgi:hypothetical protein
MTISRKQTKLRRRKKTISVRKKALRSLTQRLGGDFEWLSSLTEGLRRQFETLRPPKRSGWRKKKPLFPFNATLGQRELTLRQ